MKVLSLLNSGADVLTEDEVCAFYFPHALLWFLAYPTHQWIRLSVGQENNLGGSNQIAGFKLPCSISCLMVCKQNSSHLTRLNLITMSILSLI